MKTLPLLICMLIFSSVYSQTSSVFQTIDTIIMTNYKLSVYKWDSVGNNISEENYMLDDNNSNWYLAGKTNYEYNSSKMLVSQIYYMFNTPGLVPFSKSEFIKNSMGKDSLKLSFSWNSTLSNWYQTQREGISYNQNGQILKLTGFILNNGNWDTAGFEEYTYNANSKLIKRESKYFDQNTNLWKSFSKYTYTYNAQGLLASEIYQEWEYMYPNHWDNLYKDLYNYDENGDLVEDIFYEGDYNTWTLSQRLLNYYNTSKSASNDKWPQSFSEYGNNTSSLNCFQSLHELSYRVNYFRTNQNTWQLSGDSTLYKYCDFVDAINVAYHNNPIKVFPNPCTSSIHFEGFEPLKKYNIQLVDIHGRTVLSKTISESSIEVNELHSGIYLTNIFLNGKLVASKKIVKN